MLSIAADAGVLLAEAWMTPFGVPWRTIHDTIATGCIGEVMAIEAEFRFRMVPDAAANYRWDAAQGGGALLDVGIYTLGVPVALWARGPTS